MRIPLQEANLSEVEIGRFKSDMVVLRYAHAFAGGGGGVEQYLEYLDRSLLALFPWTILRILLCGEEGVRREERISEGKGTLVKVFVPVSGKELPELFRQGNETEAHPAIRSAIRDFLVCNPVTWGMFGRKLVLSRSIKRRPGEPRDIADVGSDLIARYRVDLVMLHFQGGADADDLIKVARNMGVAVGLQNHFANDRFRHLSMRKHALLADGVAGVSGLDVPSYLSKKFVDLADGIDLTIFDDTAGQIETHQSDPLRLLLPARVVRSKGHLDLVIAARELVRKGFNIQVEFAGREEPGEFSKILREAIQSAGIVQRVKFLGSLDQQGVRAAYARAAVVVLPTYHHEGLPRVSLEAQAMRVPVVIYATGGSPGSIRPDSSGFLVPTGDCAMLIKCLEKLVSDPELRVRMGDSGRKFVEERFSLRGLALRHAAFYRGVLSARNRPLANPE